MPDPIRTIEDVQNGGHTLHAICRNAGCRHSKKVDIPRLLHKVSAQALLRPGPHEKHFTDSMRCDHCRWRGVYLWVEPKEHKRQILKKPVPPKLPNFMVVDHGGGENSGNEIIATADNLMVALGAYAAAAMFYKDRRITLKQGIFLVKDSKDGKPIELVTEERLDGMRQAAYDMAHAKPPTLKAS